jgi:hypothetical protein
MEHERYITAIRIVTAEWVPERLEAAGRLCTALNKAFNNSHSAPAGHEPFCMLVPAVYGKNYTEKDLQDLIIDGVLAEPPRISGSDGLLDQVLALNAASTGLEVCLTTSLKLDSGSLGKSWPWSRIGGGTLLRLQPGTRTHPAM